MEDFVDIAQKLSGLGFGTLLVFILIGSYYKIWVWGHELVAVKLERDMDVAAAIAEKDMWRAMTFSATGLAETAAGIAKQRQP